MSNIKRAAAVLAVASIAVIGAGSAATAATPKQDGFRWGAAATDSFSWRSGPVDAHRMK